MSRLESHDMGIHQVCNIHLNKESEGSFNTVQLSSNVSEKREVIAAALQQFQQDF